jgi:hypothetical protein
MQLEAAAKYPLNRVLDWVVQNAWQHAPRQWHVAV